LAKRPHPCPSPAQRCSAPRHGKHMYGEMVNTSQYNGHGRRSSHHKKTVWLKSQTVLIPSCKDKAMETGYASLAFFFIFKIGGEISFRAGRTTGGLFPQHRPRVRMDDDAPGLQQPLLLPDDLARHFQAVGGIWELGGELRRAEQPAVLDAVEGVGG
jgi:hypothetical protein